MQIEISRLHQLQNKAIRTARLNLEKLGVMEPGESLEGCRLLAGRINLGNQSISALSLKQREALIHLLNKRGSMVDNPRVHYFDIKAESARRRAAKIVRFSVAKKTPPPADRQVAQSVNYSAINFYQGDGFR